MNRQTQRFLDTCPKSYNLEHIWREGHVYKPLSILWFTFPNIFFGKEILHLEICQACGMIKK